MMNPYAVLGVPENATEEQIKDAYRALARKYQDEALSGGPLQDIAQQKMAELDAAYDAAVAALRGQGASSQTQYAYTDYTQSQKDRGYYGASNLGDVRAQINSGRMDDAETILDGIPRPQRTAEWYYLKGVIQQRRGWFDEAYNNFSTACQMDPGSQEYAAAFNNLNNNAQGSYRQTRGNSNGCGCSVCDMCSSLLCADCCCECMGGDLIPGC